MRIVVAWILLAAALLVPVTACSRQKASRETAALDAAYRAGVLTKSEYDAKRAALQSRSASMAALDEALKAGVLTKDEYDAKKAALLAIPAAPASAVPGSPQPTSVPPTAASTAVAVPPADSSQPAGAPPPPSSTPSPALQSSPAAAPAQDPQSHSYRMKMAAVMDEHGFERPMPSLSFLMPVDWQMQGATTWNIKDSCNTIQTHFVANGPDGRAVEQFPAYNWAWADDPQPLQAAAQQKARFGSHPCDIMPPMSAQDYVRRNLAKVRPNAQLLGFEPAQKLTESLAQQGQQTEQSARRYNLTQRVKSDAIKARIRYSLNGKPMEEWIVGATVITGTLGPSLNLQTMQQVQKWSYSCVAYMAGQRAPQGQLDGSAKLFELMASTFRQNPEWQAKVTGNALAIQKIEQKGIADRSAIVAKSADDTRKTQREIYENQSRSEDHNSWNFSQYQRGVDTYRDPTSGKEVELDNAYGHAWVNNQGEYLLSDQSSFDPNSVPGNTQTWKPMQVVKK